MKRVTTCFLRGGDYERGGNVSRANGAILDEYPGETREIIWSHAVIEHVTSWNYIVKLRDDE